MANEPQEEAVVPAEVEAPVAKAPAEAPVAKAPAAKAPVAEAPSALEQRLAALEQQLATLESHNHEIPPESIAEIAEQALHRLLAHIGHSGYPVRGDQE